MELSAELLRDIGKLYYEANDYNVQLMVGGEDESIIVNGSQCISITTRFERTVHAKPIYTVFVISRRTVFNVFVIWNTILYKIRKMFIVNDEDLDLSEVNIWKYLLQWAICLTRG
ncbi:3337_t:CDS:2 [Funneliformis geosporum]|nr:3337_t:CDS:2 [Funneliformis geosporum]